jgi:hypothetical protein
MLDNDTPCIAERYITASRSSNLKCETREDAPLGAAAILIAAGWSASRIGTALMRLHTKADRNTLEQMHEQIALQAERWGIERPAAVAAAVLSWWIAHVCGSCQGRRFELITGTPALSARPCRACHGTGEQPIPYGEAGKRLVAFLDDCRARGVQSIKYRLRERRE